MLLAFMTDRCRACRFWTGAAVAHATKTLAMALSQAPFAMTGMLAAKLLTGR